MLVLLSFALVLVATVLLVLGLLVSEGLGLIYVSIALSVGAAVLLVVAVRLAKPKEKSSGGPMRLAPEAAPDNRPSSPPPMMPARRPSSVGPPTAPTPVTVPPLDRDEDADEAADGAWLASDEEWSAEASTWSSGDDSEEIDFPIADYDDLTTDQIMPLLPQLYSDELDVVEAREADGQNRPEIVAELARLREEGTVGDELTGDGFVEDEDDVAGDEVAGDEDVAGEDTPAGVLADEPVAPGDDGAWGDEPDLPILGYDTLTFAEIVDLLGELDLGELDEIRIYETATKNRLALLAEIDRREATAPASWSDPAPAAGDAAIELPAAGDEPSDDDTDVAPAPARKATAKKTTARTSAASPAPARKAPSKKATAAKKAPAKKAPAKKAPARKAATSTKKAPARAATTRKATPAATTTAKKSAAKKTTPSKAPAKKATARRAPARKAPAKKATAAKKATRKR